MVLRKFNLLANEWDELPWYYQQMYLEGLEEEIAQEAGEDYERPEANSEQSHAERFKQTGESSLAHEPVESDFSGMDALIGKVPKRRVARSSQ